MKRSEVITRCEQMLTALQAGVTDTASHSPEKTRKLIEIQNEIVQAYSNSQLSDEDFVIAKGLIRQISDEFRKQ